MNRELFIGAIDLTEHVFRVEPKFIQPNILSYHSTPMKVYDIWLSHLEDKAIYNLKQMCIYKPRPCAFFAGTGFSIEVSDFNDYQLKIAEPFYVGIQCVLIFEQEYRTFTMQGRFGNER